METLRPDNETQVVEATQWALSSQSSLEICGTASKRGLGRPMETAARLDLSRMSGIQLYEPKELVMSALAGTPLAEIEAALSEQNQHLAFEPINYSALLLGDGSATQGSIGGVFISNLTGPRRINIGSARDHILGFHAVSGRGESFKSGGRVVKNVTGFDLSKLIAGSYGTLAVMTEVTFKVIPAPEKSRTVLVLGLDNNTAMRVMSEALGSPYEVSGAAHLPERAAKESKVDYVTDANAAVTAIRVEGPGPSVDFRCQALRDIFQGTGEVEELHTQNSKTLWSEIRDAALLPDKGDHQVWRLSVPPAEGAGIVRAVLDKVDGAVFFDWGGGLIWLSIKPQTDAANKIIRGTMSQGGHATLIKAADQVRSSVPVFHPQPEPLDQLSGRIKDAFDPHRILNPGRMVAGR